MHSVPWILDYPNIKSPVFSHCFLADIACMFALRHFFYCFLFQSQLPLPLVALAQSMQISKALWSVRCSPIDMWLTDFVCFIRLGETRQWSIRPVCPFFVSIPKCNFFLGVVIIESISPFFVLRPGVDECPAIFVGISSVTVAKPISLKI